MTAAGWKRPGKQCCVKFREVKLGSLDNSQTVVTTQQIQIYSGDFNSVKVSWSLVRSSYTLLEVSSGKYVNKNFQILVAVLKNY